MERGIEVRDNGAKIVQVCGNEGAWYVVYKPDGTPSDRPSSTRLKDARKEADKY